MKQASIVMQSGYMITLVCVVIFLTMLYFMRHIFVSCYSNDPQVADYAATLLIYCCLYMCPDSFQMASIGILRGFKDTRVIMYVSFLAYWVVAIPVGYCLSHGVFSEPYMAKGIWVGFILGLSVACICYVLRVLYIFKHTKDKSQTTTA